MILQHKNLIEHETFVYFMIHEFGLPVISTVNVGISLSNFLSPLASTWFECTSFPGSFLLTLVDSVIFSVLLILVSTVLWAVSFHVTHFSTSPTANLTCVYSLTCATALTDLGLQCFAKCPHL